MMKFSRRQFLCLAGAVASPAFPRIAASQAAYPNRPVRIVAGFAPGGVADLYARLIAQSLSDRLGQQFVVDNRIGAGGSIATEAVVRSAPDGYTLLLTGSNDAWNIVLYDLSFDYLRDITPVAGLIHFEGALAVQPSFPAATAAELVAYVKANPGKITIATSGIGSAGHVFWELLKSRAGINMVHVPYRGEGQGLLDLLGGQVQVMIPTIPASMEYIRTGKLRALAVTGAGRSEVLPDVPPLADVVPGYEAGGWVGIGVPRNTPPDISDRLNSAINAALADPKVKARIFEQGGSVLMGSRADFTNFVVGYTNKWAKVIRAANIKAE